MKGKVVLTFVSLALIVVYSYQRTLLVHYSVEMQRLKNKRKELSVDLRVLNTEIRRHATPDFLYAYWQKHHTDLHFPAKRNSVPPRATFASLRE